MRGTCANQVLLYLDCMSQPNYSNVVHPLQLSLRWQAEAELYCARSMLGCAWRLV